jgi:Kef-type K+ transport system membrane component KefB
MRNLPSVPKIHPWYKPLSADDLAGWGVLALFGAAFWGLDELFKSLWILLPEFLGVMAIAIILNKYLMRSIRKEIRARRPKLPGLEDC